MQSDLPKTVNEALKILAYNDYFWHDPSKAMINPHPKDRSTVISLAESQYAWTEKQAKLALMILKRYLTKFQAHGMDIKGLVDNPVYEDEFRVLNFEKTIRYVTSEEDTLIELRFPYNKKVIQLIRCLKDKRDLPANHYSYDGDSKKWLFEKSDVTVYYLTLIAARYDFKFIDKSILSDFDRVNKEISGHRVPSATIIDGKLKLNDAPESLQGYWNENLEDRPLLQQVDALKNFRIDTSGIDVEAHNELAKKIALKNYHKLWLDANSYTKQQVIQALIELDAFPILMPCHSDVQESKEVEEFWQWLNVFKNNGIDILNQCSWGFDLKEPVYHKDKRIDEPRTMQLNNQISKESFENSYELYQMSKQFKFMDKNTKVIFVRNRIPRALIKSGIKPKASLVALGGGYYATGTDNLKRLLENLPKKLYYSDHQPSSWDWHDNIIIKL